MLVKYWIGVQSTRFVEASIRKLKPGGPRKTMVNPFVVERASESRLSIVGGTGTTYAPDTNCLVPPFMLRVPTREYDPGWNVPGRINSMFVPAEPLTENEAEDVN